MRHLPLDQIALLNARGLRRLTLYILFSLFNTILIDCSLLYGCVPPRRRPLAPAN
jgi:hypothetical protein